MQGGQRAPPTRPRAAPPPPTAVLEAWSVGVPCESLGAVPLSLDSAPVGFEGVLLSVFTGFTRFEGFTLFDAPFEGASLAAARACGGGGALLDAGFWMGGWGVRDAGWVEW